MGDIGKKDKDKGRKQNIKKQEKTQIKESILGRKKMKKFFSVFLVLAFLAGVVLTTSAQQLQPFSQKIKVRPQNYRPTSWLNVPLIAWGADIVTVHANGDNKQTTSGSAFDRQGLKIKLYREDDFVKQVESYLKGETPFLRGTMGMLNMAADVTEKDDRTKMVVIFQHSWSAGGDAFVTKPGINKVEDLRGKTIAIQAYGPHVDYMTKLLADAGLTLSDVKIIWTRDLFGLDGDTPAGKFFGSDVDACFVIIPDALALTSDGTVGTGAEDSVKGARILLSTNAASRIISDVYAVRKDYYTQHQDQVILFVEALMQIEEEVRDLHDSKGSRYNKMLSASAGLILDDTSDTKTMEDMAFLDAEIVGYDGNVKFFADPNNRRNFDRLTSEIQAAYIPLGLLSGTTALTSANWDYSQFSGLKYANMAETPRFDATKVQTVVARKQAQGTLDEEALFSFVINFQANQDAFPVDAYRNDFDEVLDKAATYAGAIITIEGHSDPMKYLREKNEGAAESTLRRLAQQAKNLSYSRANAVRDAVISYARLQGMTMDPNQFAIVGHGLTNPLYPVPQNQQQWLDNMRVVFQIIGGEAEDTEFVPLGN